MATYEYLTDHDFELLVADLFGEDEGVRYEVFDRGSDLGIDLRNLRAGEQPDVVQCKHYLRSTFAQLRSAAHSEAGKLRRLVPAPGRYRFVTSHPLTVRGKNTIAGELVPFVTGPQDVWGKSDLDMLLNQHAKVEQRHIKLWLPSSAQLQAVVNSGIHARSMALIEGIKEALPRWVPGEAFNEAKRILRKEKVCVIAGVPGIGKTVLAKMLVADAIWARYQPVAVSEDIEEAWRMYSPGRKQVFYYDDFLGSTALRMQLGKNEEDRLLQFIRSVSQSKSTLFILTTREYILQQAHQLYEHLGREHSPERKFLLELKHYSRWDKARILYNHIYVGGKLSRDAVLNLLHARGYEKIIDHPEYNPRQIEWITGLSGHRLTPEEDADFVTFAVEALNHPEMIWRHGFENQIERHHQGMLIALATLPDRVALADWQSAFHGYCQEQGLPEATGTFERGVDVLDNSFVETLRERDTILASFKNPGIEDVVASYTRSDEREAVRLLRGAVYFEQVMTLARLLALKSASREVVQEFFTATERCFAAASCTWEEVYLGRDARTTTTMRKPGVVEDRVELLSEAATWESTLNSTGLQDRARTLLDSMLQSMAAGWRQGRGDGRAAIRLLRRMRGRSRIAPDILEAAKAFFLSHLTYPYAFSLLADFHKEWPQLFTAEEWHDLGLEFREVATKELGDPLEFGAVEEVDQIDLYGEEMGVVLDRELLRTTRLDVEERVAREQERTMDGYDGDTDPTAPEQPDDRADEQIAAMFHHLLGD